MLVTTVALGVAVTTEVMTTAEEAGVSSGISMGTPTPLQVVSTAWIVAFWSASVQAFLVQGWTSPRSSVPFLQWQAKSLRSEQPSLLRGPRKHAKAHFGMLSSWAEAAVARAKTVAIAETFMVTDFRSNER
jgi:hypothetical protein